MAFSGRVPRATNDKRATVTYSTLWSQLSDLAEQDPGAVLLADTVREYTRGDICARAGRLATGLSGLGVGPGDRVALHTANRVEQLETLFALNALGAVYSPLHPDLRGSSLRHTVTLLEPSLVIFDPARAGCWEAVVPSSTPQVLVGGMPSDGGLGIPFEDLLTDDGPAATAPAADPEAAALILMTSGTTGRSKGVVMSSRFARSVGEVNVRARQITAIDRLHSDYSFCHTNPHCFTLFPALAAGASMSWGERFSVSAFWSRVRDLGATQFSLFTATMLMLLNAEESEGDRSHGASVCFSVGTPRGRGLEFEERFGVRIIEAYGMSECGALTFQPVGARRLESAGKPVPEWDVRVVGPSQRSLAVGEVGEIVARPLQSGMLMNGYFRDDAATLRTYKDLWFHTGDSGYFDGDGYLWYVGRAGDVIRYRGENISATDVEETVRATSLVRDVAAVALASDLGEDELMLVVEPLRPDLPARELYDSLVPELPPFCLPRHIRVVDELPRNVTGRVLKHVLREQGTPTGTWSAPTTRRTP